MKRKRKHGETSLVARLGLILLAGGLVTLVLLSVRTIWQLLLNPPIDSTSDSSVMAPANLLKDSSLPVRANFPEGVKMIVTLDSGDIFTTSAENGTLLPTGLRGSETTVSPDGYTLAYVRNEILYVHDSTGERQTPLSGKLTMPRWGADGKYLAVVERESTGDSIIRFSLSAWQADVLLTVSQIAAPPVANPATGRLLIVEKVGMGQTTFYTIDPDCATQGACLASRRNIATIPYSVSWADYHPNAGSIVFSDDQSGNLHLLLTGNGQVQPILADGQNPRCPIFSRDGRWLAYEDASEDGNLNLIKLSDNSKWIVNLSHAVNWAWVN